MFGRDGSWGEARRWTAEEGRHSIVIRDYLTVTRPRPVELERVGWRRSARARCRRRPVASTASLSTLQELATRIAHRNTGKLLEDPVGYELMARVAADENFHHLFYRDLTSAALELDPSATMIAIDHEVRRFAMPGTGIPNFDVHAQRIARAGIYDLNVHHEQILVPIVMRQWKIAELTGLSAEAEKPAIGSPPTSSAQPRRPPPQRRASGASAADGPRAQPASTDAAAVLEECARASRRCGGWVGWAGVVGLAAAAERDRPAPTV